MLRYTPEGDSCARGRAVSAGEAAPPGFIFSTRRLRAPLHVSVSQHLTRAPYARFLYGSMKRRHLGVRWKGQP